MGVEQSKHKKICKECNQELYNSWCNACNAKHFQQNFKKWTSGNDDIDKFIQDTQLQQIIILVY